MEECQKYTKCAV